jgi:hypothetical protein
VCGANLRAAAVGAEVAARAMAEAHDTLPAPAAAARAGIVGGAEPVPGAAIVALQQSWALARQRMAAGALLNIERRGTADSAQSGRHCISRSSIEALQSRQAALLPVSEAAPTIGQGNA